MLEKLLLATDGSPSALAAARWVADLGSQAPGITVTVLYVQSMGSAWMGASPDGGAALPEPTLLVDMLRKEAAAAHEATLGILAASPVQTETRTATGAPGETIVRVAEELHSDLIVLGRRGLNPLTHLLVGSVSARVVALARCPVLVVRG